MLGYLRAEKPGVLEPPPDGWYDTGDIVEIDADGFVTIKGRAKRFAKVAGEMVPLGAVEDFVAEMWPESQHAVVTLPDPKRGEQLVLVTDHADANRAALATSARDAGLPEIFVPRSIVLVAEGPDPRNRQDRLRLGLTARHRARARVVGVRPDGEHALRQEGSEERPTDGLASTSIACRPCIPACRQCGKGICSAPVSFNSSLRRFR